MMKLILYIKPDCHLCEGLKEKLSQITAIPFELEIRDINDRQDWLERYEYEIPVLCVQLPTEEKPLPRLSPRGSLKQLEALLHPWVNPTEP